MSVVNSKHGFIVFTLIVIFTFFTSAASASSKPTLNIAIIDWCPFICMSEGKPSGILIKLTNQIYGTDYNIVYQLLPWSRAIKQVETGEIHALLGVAKNEAPNLIFPVTPMFEQRFCFYVENDDHWKYTDIKSLSYRRVVYPQDALPESLMNVPDSSIFLPMSYTNNIEQFIRFVKAKRANTLLFIDTAMEYYFKLHTEDFMQRAGCISKQDVFIAFSPKNVANEVLIELNDVLMPY